MGFSIKGLDEAKKMLDDMVHDLEPEAFGEWANKIEKTAKEICDDPDCKRITFKPKKGTTEISVKVSDKEAIDCIKKAIDKHLSSMTIGLQAFYQQSIPAILKNLEDQLEEQSNSK